MKTMAIKSAQVRIFVFGLVAVVAATGFSSTNLRAQDSVAYWLHEIQVPAGFDTFAQLSAGQNIELVTTDSGSGPMLIGSLVTEPVSNPLLYLYDHAGCINPDSTWADRDPSSPLYDPNPTAPIPGRVWTLNELVGPVWLDQYPQLNSSKSSATANKGSTINSTGLVVLYVWDSTVDPSGRDTRMPVYLDLTDPVLELKLVPTPLPITQYDRISQPIVSDAGDIHFRLEERDATGNPVSVQSYLYKPARNGEPEESILLPDLGVSFDGLNALRQLVAEDTVNKTIVRYTITDSAGNGIVDEIPAVAYSSKGRPGRLDWALDRVQGLNNFGQFTAKLVVSGGGQNSGTYVVRYGGAPGNLVEERRFLPPVNSLSPNQRPNDSGDIVDSVGPSISCSYYFHEGAPAAGDESLIPRTEDLILPESDPTGFVTVNGLHAAVVSNRDSTGYGWIVGHPQENGYKRDGLYLMEPIVPSAEPGIIVDPVANLITSESGNTATFNIVLNTEPTANVNIGISSSNTDEGTVDQASLTFTPANWDVPQTVTITGVDDAIEDGDVAYTIVTAAATSTDPDYDGLDADDVFVTNEDDDGQSGGGSETYDATDVPQGGLDIPDNDPLGESSIIEDVPDLPFIGLTVTLDISHPRPSDLEVWLVPDANSTDQAVQLFNFTGQNDVTDDFTSSFGDWTLEVYDTRKKKKGTLYGWSITIDY